MRYVFFGTPTFATTILDALKSKGYTPSLIVSQPAKPQGRKHELIDSPVAVWAKHEHIPLLTPERLKENGEFLQRLRDEQADCFVVAAYGKILRKELLDIPPRGVLNVHPSLLPKFRGPSPVEAAILAGERTTGVSIMLLDEAVDHGAIIASESYTPSEWPPKGSTLEHTLAELGGNLLAKIIGGWVSGKITATSQDDSKATYCKKITKEDGNIDLGGNPEESLRKIRAFDTWPGAYTFVNRNNKTIRLRILDANIRDGKLIPTMVLPEGKSAMRYEDFLRGDPNITRNSLPE